MVTSQCFSFVLNSLLLRLPAPSTRLSSPTTDTLLFFCATLLAQASYNSCIKQGQKEDIRQTMSEDKPNVIKGIFSNIANDLEKERALHLCSSHLQGNWTSLTEDDIDLSAIESGFVNRLFLCHNKKSNETVVIRLYGGKILIEASDYSILRHVGLEGEVLIFHLMHVNGIGPGLLGVFDGGRIEQYLEGGHTLSNDDLKNNEITTAMASKLAKMHSLEMPLNKNPKDLISISRESVIKHLEHFNEVVREKELPEGSPKELTELVESCYSFDWMELIDWFEKTLPSIKTRSVFSHNDMNLGNFLVFPNKSGDDKITFLDFESAGYNHRGADIGHHFRHRQFDVKKFNEEGGETFDSKIAYPSEEERRLFIREYLKVAMKSYNPVDENIDNEDHLLLEAEFYGGLHHLFMAAFTMLSVDGFKDMDFPVHLGVIMGGIIKDLGDRKRNVIDLLKRFSHLLEK